MVIKYLYLKSLTPKEIKAELNEVHSTFARAFTVNEFKHGLYIHKRLTWFGTFSGNEYTGISHIDVDRVCY